MVGDANQFANIFLNKLGAVKASSVIGCLEPLLEMQRQRVNTPSVLFDGHYRLCCDDPAFNISWPDVAAAFPTSSHDTSGSFMLAVEDVTTMFGP